MNTKHLKRNGDGSADLCFALHTWGQMVEGRMEQMDLSLDPHL